MRFRVFVCLAAVIAGTVIAGCGSSGGGSSQATTTSSSTATEAAQVKHDWIEFFDPSTPPSRTVSLLQNGTKFAAVIDAQAKSAFAKESSVSVSAVKLTSPTTATVTYTLKLAGQPVPGLKNTTGTAVKTGTTWQVADSSFCKLLKLQGPVPAACPNG
jgi:hypothetical protein